MLSKDVIVSDSRPTPASLCLPLCLHRHCFTFDNNDNASPTLVADIAVALLQADPVGWNTGTGDFRETSKVERFC